MIDIESICKIEINNELHGMLSINKDASGLFLVTCITPQNRRIDIQSGEMRLKTDDGKKFFVISDKNKKIKELQKLLEKQKIQIEHDSSVIEEMTSKIKELENSRKEEKNGINKWKTANSIFTMNPLAIIDTTHEYTSRKMEMKWIRKRIENGLKELGISTVQELIEIPVKKIRQTKTIGPKCLVVLEHSLNKLNLSLKNIEKYKDWEYLNEKRAHDLFLIASLTIRGG